jgi:predicted nucleotidyltransferase
VPDGVDDLIQEFKGVVRSYGPREVVQRSITTGACVHLDASAYVELKQRVAAEYQISHADVLVVGSAKLGFSISPKRRWGTFGDDSDIDVAIVSTALYRALWQELSEVLTADPVFNWDRRTSLAKYHLRGWLRPDMLPVSPALRRADKWFEFFRSLTAEQICGPYKISAGVYYDLEFLELYQSRAVAMCKENDPR